MVSQIIPKISIIVPMFNAGDYIYDCLKSLVNQTFQDIEIIIVDDGSTDKTLKIVSEFERNDDRIKVLKQKNLGPSKARNEGVSVCRGEYISFVDADDWVDNNFFEKLYEAITKQDADIACASIIRYRKNFQKYRVHYEKDEVYSAFEDKIKAVDVPRCCYIWSKLYKASFIKKYPFKEGVFFEDVLWVPDTIKNSNKLVTVSGVNYYYRANKKSIVKKPSKKKIRDNYYAKKYMASFLKKNNLPIGKKYSDITKSVYYLFNIPVFKIKESLKFEVGLLFDFIPLYKKRLKSPIIKENTFLIWEPCLKNHAEVVPGYAKYLLELGYHVSILLNPDRYKERLFSRFPNDNISYNLMSRKEIKDYFRRDSLCNIKGVLVTTGGKLCDKVNIEECYNFFSPNVDKSKLHFVFHDAKPAVDAGTWRENIITLRKLDYKGAKSVVVNPHYFGDVKITPKNDKITNFITIGAIQGKKKNNDLIINAVKELHNRGIGNFKITVIGKGRLKKLPKELHPYFDIKGRLPFDKMYDEIEKADFILTSYKTDNPNHIFYNTSGTSGNFQLVYGFLKPCVIVEEFAKINGFTSLNSILYKTDNEFADALQKGIEMSREEYSRLQEDLKIYVDRLHKTSYENLKALIKKNGNGGLYE